MPIRGLILVAVIVVVISIYYQNEINHIVSKYFKNSKKK